MHTDAPVAAAGTAIRLAAMLAGLMGALGVVFAAAAAHQPDATRLGRRPQCCCFTPAPLLERLSW